MVRHHGRDHDDVTPGYLSGMLSQLHHCFDARGRLGTWEPLAMSGTPCAASKWAAIAIRIVASNISWGAASAAQCR